MAASKLTALIAQWREMAKTYDEDGYDDSAAYDKCADELESALAEVSKGASREEETMLLAAAKAVLAQFDAGYFVRNTDSDGCSDWAIKAMEPLRALAALKSAIEVAEASGRPTCTCAQESAPAFCRLHGDPLYRDPEVGSGRPAPQGWQPTKDKEEDSTRSVEPVTAPPSVSTRPATR